MRHTPLNKRNTERDSTETIRHGLYKRDREEEENKWCAQKMSFSQGSKALMANVVSMANLRLQR